MALNLSTLTSPANSSVLEEVNTTADFLESVPVLRNLARGSQKGGDAKQDVALNQPKALPLIDGDGYLYLSGVSGNHASIPNESSFNLGTELEIRCKVTCKNWTPGTNQLLVAKSSSYSTSLTSFYLELSSNGKLSIIYNDGSNVDFAPSTVVTGISDGSTKWIKATLNTNQSGSAVINYYLSDDNISYTQLGATVTKTARGDIHDTAHPITIGHGTNNFGGVLLGAVHQVQIFASNNGTSKILDADFTATNVRHGDTKFKCATGQVVTINKSGNDPATIIKKPVLRFDGANDFMQGLLNQTITGSSIFIAYSVLGDGGVSGRLLGLNSTGANDNDAGGYFLARDGSTTNVIQRYNGGSNIVIHAAMYDDALGDVLLEADIKNGSQISKLNNANQANGTTTVSGDLSSEEFKIASFTSGSNNGAIDLEYLALFDATITDAQADSVRNYINNRNNVFSLIDSQGYYFFDPQKATFTGNFTNFSGGNRLDGYITGSDNGDTNVRSNLTLIQETGNDQPSTDGYTITFHDNAEHLEFKNGVSQNLSGWQVVGTSLGTFAYRVDSDAVTELNLLGNAGTVRSIGDLYGIILLPASATGKDIEDARKLLIDRGAADGVSASNVASFWQSRDDIVEFNSVSFSGTDQANSTWRYADNMVSFNVTSMPSLTFAHRTWADCTALISFGTSLDAVTHALEAWKNCTSLSDFRTTNLENCAQFTSAWQGCTALTSFPAGAKLGTEATNVNFTSAWQASGLTSFPDLDLSKGNIFTNAWRETSLTSFSTPLPTANNLIQSWYNCNSLQSFSSELPEATNVSFAWYNNTSLTDFNTTDLKNCTNFTGAFQSCTALTSFPSDALLGTSASNVNFSSAWRSSGLTSFPPLDLSNAVNFSNAFRGTAITQFPSDALLGTDKTNVNFNSAFRSSDIISFSTPLPTGNTFADSFKNCGDLTDVSVDVFTNWNPSTIANACFNDAWDGCTSLTAQSVENILVSIDASGKYGTATGASGGGSIDSGIDIDYDGTTLSSATDSAITSLRGKSWVVYINGVERIP